MVNYTFKNRFLKKGRHASYLPIVSQTQAHPSIRFSLMLGQSLESATFRPLCWLALVTFCQ